MDESNRLDARALLALAGLVGAAGILAAATASHNGESRNLTAMAAICLAHGPALLALGLLAPSRLLRAAGVILAIGTLVFVTDLGMREWLGRGAFPGAAPAGGGAMVLGWLLIAAAGLVGRKI